MKTICAVARNEYKYIEVLDKINNNEVLSWKNS